jgi:hypothetical protein
MFKTTIVSGLFAFSAFAQNTLPPKDMVTQKIMIKLADENAFGPIGITAALAGPMATVPGAPYSAQAVTQRVQVLADGNRITQTTTNSVARDSQGRVRREESLPGLGNGAAEPPHLVLIEDPVAGVHITLDSNSKTAIKMNSQQMKKADEAAMRNGLPPMNGTKTWFNSAGPGQQEIHILTTTKGPGSEAKTSKTDLGTQTIEGVVAKGTKTTRTILAGDVGNDLPLVISTETWYSPDLKALVMSKSSDPRMGETTYKLTNLSRSEPDPTLFQIPADYTLRDQPAGDVVMYKALDK